MKIEAIVRQIGAIGIAETREFDVQGLRMGLDMFDAIHAHVTAAGWEMMGGYTPKYTWHTDNDGGAVRIPVISYRELLTLPNGTPVAGGLPIGIPAMAHVWNGSLKVTSHKVPQNFADFAPYTVILQNVRYGVE